MYAVVETEAGVKMPPKTYLHWYEWAGDFLKDAMKGWGLATILILIPVASVAHLSYNYGGRYLEASILKMEKEAAAATAVAVAVTDLTALAKEAQVFQQVVSKEHAQIQQIQTQMLQVLEDAKTRMSKVAEERAEQTTVLRQIHAAIASGT